MKENFKNLNWKFYLRINIYTIDKRQNTVKNIFEYKDLDDFFCGNHAELLHVRQSQ